MTPESFRTVKRLTCVTPWSANSCTRSSSDRDWRHLSLSRMMPLLELSDRWGNTVHGQLANVLSCIKFLAWLLVEQCTRISPWRKRFTEITSPAMLLIVFAVRKGFLVSSPSSAACIMRYSGQLLTVTLEHDDSISDEDCD